MSSEVIGIIGGKGKTGARVNNLLVQQNRQTRPLSRSTTPAFDWQDQTSWRTALAGVKALYISFQPDLAIPSAKQSIKDLIALAKDLNIEHLVLLSGRGEDGAQKAENILRESGISWNVVRASWFSQNFSEGFMCEGILTGELALPVGEVKEPFVDIDDVAEVAVAALTKPSLRNRLFEVTGPRALSFKQCVEEIAHQTKSNIKFTQISTESFLSALAKQGAPADLQWLMKELFTVVLDGRNSEVMSGVELALGRPATDLKRTIKKAVDSGVWNRQ